MEANIHKNKIHHLDTYLVEIENVTTLNIST